MIMAWSCGWSTREGASLAPLEDASMMKWCAGVADSDSEKEVRCLRPPPGWDDLLLTSLSSVVRWEKSQAEEGV